MISHIQHAEWIAQKVETRQIERRAQRRGECDIVTELKTLTAARG
jgi:hypothetical protein